MKYLLLILLSFVASMNAGSQEDDGLFLQRQELFYDAGVSLAHQEKVINWQSFKNAAIGVYNEVQGVQELIDLLFMMDENLIENDMRSFDELIDSFDKQMSKTAEYQEFEIDLIVLVAAYQRIFSIFIKMHPSEPTFEIFSGCLDDYLESSDHLLYDEMKDALDGFVEAFNIFQDKMEDLF